MDVHVHVCLCAKLYIQLVTLHRQHTAQHSTTHVHAYAIHMAPSEMCIYMYVSTSNFCTIAHVIQKNVVEFNNTPVGQDSVL